ncbi:MAG: hypothetical protein IK955_09550 [Clostridia bacterium]|nr:hypothetical protein [Clostridia bacterium]
MAILYVISKYVTFFGAALKAFWEQIFCRIMKIPVQDARWTQANELCGHIDHDFSESKAKTFLICYLPGMMNRFLAYGMFISSYIGLFYIEVSPSDAIFWIYLVMFYLAVSLLCNNAPLYEDALWNWDLLYGKDQKTNIAVKILGFIPSAYFIASAWLEKYAVSLLIYVIAALIGIFVI